MTLLPAATEIVAALGAEGEIVGVSHECDVPPSVRERPRVTSTQVDAREPGAAIDRRVRRLREAGRPVIAVDATLLRALVPDVIVTQQLCDVCAVGDGAIRPLAELLDPVPAIVPLEGRTLGGIWNDIRAVGRAIGREGEAHDLVAALEARLAALPILVHERVSQALRVPRVLCVEWLEPLSLAGHWVPELVAAAGGEDVGAEPGAESARATWSSLAPLRADVLIVMLCGFDVARARAELDRLEDADALRILSSVPVWILDGNAFTSRPGPRVVDGAERIHAALLGRTMAGIERWVRPHG